MKKLIAYLLILVSLLGIISTAIVGLYLLFILFFFCHFSQCWPQFIFIPIASVVVVLLFTWMMKSGIKLLKG